ncbi:MAG: discoidin domain-containing protein [Acutalibacteraceae bacterium]|jgi:lysophospholipase L1-like esterase
MIKRVMSAFLCVCLLLAVVPMALADTPAVEKIDLSGATASASSVSSGFAATNAIDGNQNSFWNSNKTGSNPCSHKLTLQLDAVYVVDHFVFKIPMGSWGDRDEGAVISVSNNGLTFTPVKETTLSFVSGDNHTVTVTLDEPVKASSLQLEITSNSDAGELGRAQLGEWEIYGYADPDSAGMPVVGKMPLTEEQLTASSTDGTYPLSRIIDGNNSASSYWRGGAMPASVTVDFGGVCIVDAVVLKVPPTWGDRTQTIELLGSDDGVEFSTLIAAQTYSFVKSEGNTVTLMLPANTRTGFLKIQVTSNSGDGRPQFSELEVYGVALPEEPDHPIAAKLDLSGADFYASTNNYGGGAAAAFDGNQGTYWNSNSHGADAVFSETLTANLLDVYVVDHFVFKVPANWAARTQTATITGSMGGLHFDIPVTGPIPLAFDPANGNTVTVLLDAPVSVRYLRLEITASTNSEGRGQIGEWEIYGWTDPDSTAAAQTTVVCVGDSITYGDRISDPGQYAYPVQLWGMLGDDYRVLNRGRNGCTMGEHDRRYIYRDDQIQSTSHRANKPVNQKDIEDADVVIIMLGTNDANLYWTVGDEDAKANYLDCYTEMIAQFLAWNSDLQFILATPATGCSARGAGGLNVKMADVAQVLREYYADNYADNDQFTLVDINTLTSSWNGGHDDWYADNVHFNETGYGMLAELFYNALTGTPQPEPGVNYIRTVDDLRALQGKSLGETYVLMNDLDLTGENWTPITSLSGTFDGNGHTVSGLTVDSTDSVKGMFATIAGGTVQDLTIAGATVGTGRFVGALAGDITGGLVQNVTVDATVTGAKHTGVVVGRIYPTVGAVTLENVSTTAASSITGTDGRVGGIVGAVFGGSTVTLTNCTNAAAVTNSSSTAAVGGIVAYTEGTLVMTGCVNAGGVTNVGIDYTGGLVGHVSGTSSLQIVDGRNTGFVSGGRFTGGLVGGNNAGATVVIVNSVCQSDFSGNGKQYIAGLYGFINSGTVYLINNAVVGSLTGNGSYRAGLVGNIAASATVYICNNYAAVSGRAGFTMDANATYDCANNFAPLSQSDGLATQTALNDMKTAAFVDTLNGYRPDEAVKAMLSERQIALRAWEAVANDYPVLGDPRMEITVTFVGKYNETIAVKSATSAEELAAVLQNTTATALGGYAFTGWSENPADAEQLFDAGGDITVTAVYEQEPAAKGYHLTVGAGVTAKDGLGSAVDGSTDLSFDQRITVTAEGDVAYWVLDGAKVGFGKNSYTFYVSGNNSIEVVTGEAGSLDPAVVLQQATYAQGSETFTLTVIAQTSIPSGNVSEYGVIFTSKVPTTAFLSDPANAVVKVKSSKTGANQQYMAHLLNVKPDKIRYARAYAIVDGVTVYSATAVQFKTAASGVTTDVRAVA